MVEIISGRWRRKKNTNDLLFGHLLIFSGCNGGGILINRFLFFVSSFILIIKLRRQIGGKRNGGRLLSIVQLPRTGAEEVVCGRVEPLVHLQALYLDSESKVSD